MLNMTLKSRKHQRVNVKLENQFTKLEFFPLLNLICKCWKKINLTNLINSEFSDIYLTPVKTQLLQCNLTRDLMLYYHSYKNSIKYGRDSKPMLFWCI